VTIITARKKEEKVENKTKKNKGGKGVLHT
jgi:hypothetical protein